MFLLNNIKYKKILDINNLEIKEGKITCIVGESGSGKTTLLRMLNKLISCDSGEIFFRNRLIDEIDSVQLRRNVIMLPQEPAIFSGSIKDNLLIGLKFSEKQEAAEGELQKALKTVYLRKMLDDEADKLSGGEKQRLALARVMLMNPEVLLLDEPSSALDEDTELLIIEKLVNYSCSNNKTLVMVTHSKNIARQFANEVIKIKDGTVTSVEEV
ncbi:ABC transporter ATP-binding protein [Proteinivorax tanatarense]|uniref:ABC transporter ATP-binding protein n=1 Tax=Proteinivorax tanatarense TaxID=1260629 RepID=A0AAU7VM69_9FIRM